MTIYSLDIPFPIWNQSVVPCPVLTIVSWTAYIFLRRHVRWSGIPISWRVFHSLLWSTIALISHASKVMLNILQDRLQQYVNRELPDVQAGFRKGRRTRDQIANIHWITEKAREFQKNICFIGYAMLWLCGSQQTGKFWKRWEYQATWPASWEICMQVKKQ